MDSKIQNLGLPLYMIAISHCFRFPAVLVNSLALIVSQCKALEHVIGVVPQRIRMQSTCCCCNRQSRLIQSLRVFVCHKIHKDSVLCLLCSLSTTLFISHQMLYKMLLLNISARFCNHFLSTT